MLSIQNIRYEFLRWDLNPWCPNSGFLDPENLNAFEKAKLGANSVKLVMQVSIGDVRGTWANVEPDSVMFYELGS